MRCNAASSVKKTEKKDSCVSVNGCATMSENLEVNE